MELIVRAVDVGSGNTKFVTGITGADIRCASFPSVAYPSSGEMPHWPASERRKTVCVPVGSLFYEVGPDVGLAADTFRAKQLHDEYTESPEYMALLRGALGMMKVPHVDLLIVGLPVALLNLKKAALEKAMVDQPPGRRRQDGEGRTRRSPSPSLRVRWSTMPPSTRRWRRSAASRAW
jgi:plasmid segregation protein ParM